MVGAVVSGHQPGEAAFVESGVPFEAHRERLHRMIRQAGQQPDDHAGVEPAGQEHAQRHVRDQPVTHRAFQQFAQPLRPPVAVALRRVVRSREVVVTVDPDPAVPDPHGVARQQLAHAAIDRPLSGQVLQPVQLDQRRVVRIVGHGRVAQQDRQLRSEDQAVADVPVEERLDAQAVPGQETLSAPPVVEEEREHPVEPVHHLGAVLFPQVDQDLGVGAGAEPVALVDELPGQFAIVVDLSVEDHADGAVLVGLRLRSARDVDHGEPADPGGDTRLFQEALGVRTAMSHSGQHGAQFRRLDRPGFE